MLRILLTILCNNLNYKKAQTRFVENKCVGDLSQKLLKQA